MNFEGPQSYEPEPESSLNRPEKPSSQLDLQQFDTLKDVLAKLPLPERYKHIGIKKWGDESIEKIEVWQSEESMKTQEPGERIANILIDLVERTIHVYVEYSRELDKRLIMSDQDLKYAGKSEEEITESLGKEIALGKNPFQNPDMHLVRDPRIQAIINYIIHLQNKDFRLECDETSARDRVLAIAVIEDQLKALPEPPEKVEGAILSAQQETLALKIEELNAELGYLKKLQEQHEEKQEEERQKNLKIIREPRRRRTSDPE